MFSLRIIFVLFIVIVVVGVTVFLTLAPRPTSPPLVPQTTENKASGIVSTASSSEPTIEASEVHSPDGKMNLVMEKATENEASKYFFFVSEIPETAKRKLIFEKTTPAGSVIEMSPNAWSPDNKYFFIKESNNSLVNFLVFNASGEPFSDGAENMDVVSIFDAKETGYSLSDVTGWDSETLLHVWTTTNDGARGPSYWLEVPSSAVIQLASR